MDIAEESIGIRLERIYHLDAPKGVMGRNIGNTLILDPLGWEPSIRLRDRLEWTYLWSESEIIASGSMAIQGRSAQPFPRCPGS